MTKNRSKDWEDGFLEGKKYSLKKIMEIIKRLDLETRLGFMIELLNSVEEQDD